jgi:hypothetical protein
VNHVELLFASWESAIPCNAAYSSAPDWKPAIENSTALGPGQYQLCVQDLIVLTLDLAPFVLALDQKISTERTRTGRNTENAGSVRCPDRIKGFRGLSLAAEVRSRPEFPDRDLMLLRCQSNVSSKNRIEWPQQE